MDDKPDEIKADGLFDALFFWHSSGVAEWKVSDDDAAFDFVADAVNSGAAVWYAGRTVCVFQPRVKLPRRLTL